MPAAFPKLHLMRKWPVELQSGLPDGAVLVHAGDFMNSGFDPQDVRSFNRWLGGQPFKHRVVCAGNHDRYFQNSPHDARFLLTNATYLENTGVTIDGVTFWGSPYTPEFLAWAFMYPRGSGAALLGAAPDTALLGEANGAQFCRFVDDLLQLLAWYPSPELSPRFTDPQNLHLSYRTAWTSPRTLTRNRFAERETYVRRDSIHG
jgi:hypothetical protein